jgi:benzoate 4-monooxygenase
VRTDGLTTGKFVRIAPNHVSVNDPEALQVIYAHGNGPLKSDFYDAFVSIRPGVFNTRSRTEHARKRRIITHVFSQKSIQAFEPHAAFHLGQLMKQWDRIVEAGLKGLKGGEGEGWIGHDGKVWFDCLPWYNYLAFDVIGSRSINSRM